MFILVKSSISFFRCVSMVVIMCKKIKVGLAGLAGAAIGICLMSFITLNKTPETDKTKITETDKTKITETETHIPIESWVPWV